LLLVVEEEEMELLLVRVQREGSLEITEVEVAPVVVEIMLLLVVLAKTENKEL
jgi:hypothetical protein